MPNSRPTNSTPPPGTGCANACITCAATSPIREPIDRWAACWTSCTSATARRAMCCSIWPPPRASSSRYCSTWARLAWSSSAKAKAGAGSSWKNPSATICPAPSTSMPRSPRCCTRIRCSASIISWARKPCRTFSRSASPMACSNRCGTATASTMCRSPRPKPSEWKGADGSTTPPAACATWCRTICSSCWR